MAADRDHGAARLLGGDGARGNADGASVHAGAVGRGGGEAGGAGGEGYADGGGGGGGEGGHGVGATALPSKLKKPDLLKSPSKTKGEGLPKASKSVAFGKLQAPGGRGAGRGDGEAAAGVRIPVGTFVPARKSFEGLRLGTAMHAANIFSETYASPRSPKAPVDFSYASNALVGGEMGVGGEGSGPVKVFPKVVIGKGAKLGAPASETLSPLNQHLTTRHRQSEIQKAYSKVEKTVSHK